MKLHRSLWLVPLTAGVLWLAASGQTPAPAKSGSGTIAVVDIATLVDKLAEKTVLTNELDKMRQDLDSAYSKRRDDLDGLQKEIEKPTVFGVGTPEYQKEQDELLMKAMEYKAYPGYEQAKLDSEMRVRTADLYKKVNTAVAAYAKANGIVLVFVADAVDFDGASAPDQLSQLILTRKLLYYDKSYDITDAVIRKMNDEYALTQNKK